MTKKQAKREIDFLDLYLQNHTDDYGEESHTAMMMAIDALSRSEMVESADDDLISRKAVLELSKWDSREGLGSIIHAFDVERLPSVKPQQKVGRWIAAENEEMEIDGYYCSYCDLPMETEEKTAYCPNCGAKMQEEGAEK